MYVRKLTQSLQYPHPIQARFLFLTPGKVFWVQFPTPWARTTVKCPWITRGMLKLRIDRRNIDNDTVFNMGDRGELRSQSYHALRSYGFTHQYQQKLQSHAGTP